MSYMEFYLRKLSDENPSVRKRIAKLLESSRKPSALYRLKAVLPREENPDAQIAMRQAIEKLTESLNRAN